MELFGQRTQIPMPLGVLEKRQKGNASLRPMLWGWVVLLLPLVFLVVFFVKWYQQGLELEKIKSLFIQRQNNVMGFNALEVATGFSDLLEKAARDIQLLSLLPKNAESLKRFSQAQTGDFTRFDVKNHAVIQEPMPFYSAISIRDLAGTQTLGIDGGQVSPVPQPLSLCLRKNLCDAELVESTLKLKPGEILYGRLLRHYTPEGVEDKNKGAGLGIAYRTATNVYVMSIEYLHLRDHLTTPTFPYDTKRDLESAYRKGNYIYIVDERMNVITHPLTWVQAGVDKTTGRWVSPMVTDGDGGKHPINVAAYKDERLKEYFARLLNVSFTANSVDIFRARNLDGINRVLSVIPISLSKGQYQSKGVFGWAVIGCNIDHFEEPKERFIPYY